MSAVHSLPQPDMQDRSCGAMSRFWRTIDYHFGLMNEHALRMVDEDICQAVIDWHAQETSEPLLDVLADGYCAYREEKS